MELRELATRILSATSMEEKLLVPGLLTDDDPGPAVCWKEPSRPPGMHFRTKQKGAKLPAFTEHHSSEKRAICLHRFAGHELLAVEIMAFSLLLFPDAPKNFRKGLAHTLLEEQEHVRLYCKRLNDMNVRFGDLELYKHFWTHTPSMQSPLQYVSLMSLTFEMANLDFAPLYGKSFERAGDPESAALMARILHDEIAHVRFGWQWLQRFKDEKLSNWEAWTSSLPPQVSPRRAKGVFFNEEPRLLSGVSPEWVSALKAL